MNLRGEIPEGIRRDYITRDRSIQLLKEWTGQDFGFDADQWESWLRANVKEFRDEE